jgi:hypothetical protein
MTEEYRSMTGDIAEAVALVLDVMLGCDIEMVNMGDWSMQDYINHAKPYEEAILKIRETKSLYGTDPKIIKKAVQRFEHFAKVFSENEV